MAKTPKSDPPPWAGGPGGPGSIQPDPETKVLIHIPPSQQSCQYPVPKAGDPVDPNNPIMEAKRAKQKADAEVAAAGARAEVKAEARHQGVNPNRIESDDEHPQRRAPARHK